MDTDELTEMAYDIIVRAARVCDTLKTELGAMSGKYKSENEWLQGVRNYLEEIMDSPDGYVDYWNLEEEEGITPAAIKEYAVELLLQVDKVLTTPLNERGTIGW
jgi:hypothetical protein